MSDEDYQNRITTNPQVMTGKPTVRGLRITVEQLLKELAANISIDDLLEDYPELEIEDIRACILYAAQLVEQERVYPIHKS